MGAADSRSRSVSYGLDEQDNVTVIHGVKLSGDVLQRMQETGPSPSSSSSSSSPSPKAESAKPEPGPSRTSAAETQEELRRRFEREQALVQEELARISRREREMAGDDINPAALRETTKTRQELDKTHNLARQLKKKDNELKHLEQFYKEQLHLMEKKCLFLQNTEYYQQTAHMYEQEVLKAEATVKPRHARPVCPELQSQVLSCYRLNPQQTLHCSQLAKDYISCINTSKKNLLVNHG